VTHLLAVLALDARPVLWLGAVLTNVANGITVSADIYLFVGAIILAMSKLTTVEARNLWLFEELA